MIKIDMDNGKRYAFCYSQYDNYYTTNDSLIIQKGNQWIGCFMLTHMIGFFVDLNDKDE